VFDVPLTVDLLDPELRVLPDSLGALMRPKARVVVDRVVGEVRGDEIGVTRVQRLVVGADVIEVADDEIVTCGCRSWVPLFVVRVKRREAPRNRGGNR
jgi:hypothetical protein